MRALVAAGAAALLLAGCTSAGHRPVAPTSIPDSNIRQLRGIPLSGRLDVRIVDGNRLIDLDGGSTRKIAGLPAGANSLIGSYLLSADTGFYAFSADEATARQITRNVSSAAPGRNGIWLIRGSRKCTLTEVSAAGRTVVPARPINCDYQIRAETHRGLLVDTNTGVALLDEHLHPIVRSQLITFAGSALITSDDQRISIAGRGSVALPASIGVPGGLYVSPDNAYVAVAFGNPACPGPRQCLDTWILRLATMKWIHPPSMPVSMYLKPHDLFWGQNDRFTWLGTFDGVGGAIATWQPGASALRVRRLSLPTSQYGVLHQ